MSGRTGEAQASASAVAAQAYPCPNCGAKTTLAPGTDSLACAHCGTKTPIERDSRPIHEHDLRGALARAAELPIRSLIDGGHEVLCKTCGARTVVTQQAARCPFCDGVMVVEVEVPHATIAPESVLPFDIDASAASGKFQDWLRRRWFAPFGMAKRAQRDGLDGVYLPYWTYDSATSTAYEGQRGDHYWDTESYTDREGKTQTRRVRKTRWWPASGTVTVAFDDVLVCASPSLPAKIIDRLEPWDLADLRPYDGRYLAGFIAERYRIDVDAGFEIAETKMEEPIRAAIRRDIGGDEQRIQSMRVRHRDTKFKHVLLPLWMSSFRFGDRVYRVTVNARSGEVAGERPWSAVKIGALVILIVALIVVVAIATRR